MVASKFSLYTDCGGGCQTFLIVVVPGMDSCICVCWNSFRKSKVLLFSQPGSLKLHPRNTVFRWFHINQAWTRKSSNSNLVSLFRRFTNSYRVSIWLFGNFWSRVGHPAHTSWAAPHSHSTCTPVSGQLPQHWQKLSGITFLLARFT